jgi:hypothetical protein
MARSITTQDIYELANQLPLDVYDRLKKQAYREADSRHVSHRAILPGLLLAALRERSFLPDDAHAAV